MQQQPIPAATRVAAAPNDRGLVGPVGVVLLIAIAVIGSIAIVTVGATALTDTRATARLGQVEHGMTQFDARAGVVALGEAEHQTIVLGSSGGGRYAVVPDAGWIRIVHHDYDASGSNETIYHGTLGALVYRSGDTTIAHEGGGVWRRDGAGSVMLSPPEFHYQEETLVLPIVQVQGQASVGGPVRATVSRGGATQRIFPAGGPVDADGIRAPYDATGGVYRNPIQGGSVTITVHSEFYRAWGRYLEARTEGTVRYDHPARTATVELTAPRTLGNFEMPAEGNAIDIRGIPDGHAVDAFRIDLAPDDADSADFFNLQWSMYAKEGAREFEIHLRLTGPDDDSSTPCKEQNVAVTVYYSDVNGNPYHGWSNETAFRTSCIDRDGDGLRDEVQLVANLTGETSLTLAKLESDDLLHFSTGGFRLATPVTFDQHATEVAWEPVTYARGDSETVGRLVNHYLGRLGPDYDLVVDDRNSDSVNEAHSSGVLLYEGEGRVTFMHITANEVRIDLLGGRR